MRRRIKNEDGQAMIEMALILPILLLLIMGIIEFGFLFSTRINMNNVVRQAVRTAVVSTASESDLEDAMRADALSLAMLADNITECDIVKVNPNVTAKLTYKAPLITGYITNYKAIEMTAQATMRAE